MIRSKSVQNEALEPEASRALRRGMPVPRLILQDRYGHNDKQN